MIIHLEAGTCPSGINLRALNQSAAQCFQWRHFVDGRFREDMIDCLDLEAEWTEKPYPFICPGCGLTSSKLSGLFQHVESRACPQELDYGPIKKLVYWLKVRHEWDIPIRVRI